jgi:hypothetical protein
VRYFNKLTEDIDPRHHKNKTPNEPRNSKWNEKNFNEDVSGLDLDIPGSDSMMIWNKQEVRMKRIMVYSLGDDNSK